MLQSELRLGGATRCKHAELCENPFTRKEFKMALKSYKKKIRKSPGPDDVYNWMLVHGGSKLHNFLLGFYNEMWEIGCIPEGLCTTLVSYIYKGKGSKDEITNYRPIALNSPVINLFRKMWLYRINLILMPQIMKCQGEKRVQ